MCALWCHVWCQPGSALQYARVRIMRASCVRVRYEGETPMGGIASALINDHLTQIYLRYSTSPVRVHYRMQLTEL